MFLTQFLKRGLLLCAVVVAGSLQYVAAQVEADVPETPPKYADDTWHVSLSPYLWLAGMNGKVTVKGTTVNVDQSVGDVLSNLKVGLMGLSEVRRGRIGVLTDLMWVRLGDEGAVNVSQLPNYVDIKATVNTFTLTPVLAYRVYSKKRLRADATAGLRYYHLDNTIKANTQIGPMTKYFSQSSSDDWADFVGGGRIVTSFTPKVGAFLIGNVGAGGSDLTWEIAAGVGYQWNKKWTSEIGYRALYFNRNASSNFALDNTQHGLLLGATYHFK